MNNKPTDSKNNVYICHTLSSVLFKKVVDEISYFLSQPGHDKEIVLIDINHLYSVDNEQLADITSYLKAKLGDKIASAQTFNPLSTYEKFWNENKQVIIFMEDDSTVENYPSIYWPGNTIASPWPNVQNTENLIQSMETNLQNRDLTKFFVLQSQLTPNKKTILDGFNIFTSEPSNLLEMTGKSQLTVSEWIFKKNIAVWKNGNIFIQDFIGGNL